MGGMNGRAAAMKRLVVGGVAALVVAPAIALAQPSETQPTPQPSPPPYPNQSPPPYPNQSPPPYANQPQPYPPPYPGPYAPYPPPTTGVPPQPFAAKPPISPPAPARVKTPLIVLLHGLCPEDTEPSCGGGLWMGFRDTTISGPPENPEGLGVDVKIGGSFGFGFEVGSDIAQNERDSMAYATFMFEGAIGPGLRLGRFEMLPALGLGGEGVAWGTTDRDDDPYSEAYWYGTMAFRAQTDDYALFGAITRKYRDRGRLDRVFADHVEGGIQFVADKAPMSVGVWITNYDTHLVAGVAFGASTKKK